MKMLTKIGVFVLISIAIYVGIALVMILSQRPKQSVVKSDEPISFAALIDLDYEQMPALQPYTARDEATLYYRQYESSAEADTVLILIHGSGWHSMQFYALAKGISESGVARVITPDLRGHGFETSQRGDVDYIGQLEDDLADLIAVVEKQYPQKHIIIGGHSSGGGLVVRFAGGSYGSTADGYILMAPFLKYNAPTTRENSGGWAQPLMRRIIGLRMLNNIGIRWFNGLEVIQFNMPESVLNGPLGESATTAYSYRMNTSFSPRSRYLNDLAAMQQPFLLVAGLEDESFIAEAYEPTLSAVTQSGTYELLPDTGHIDLLTSPALPDIIENWIKQLTLE